MTMALSMQEVFFCFLSGGRGAIKFQAELKPETSRNQAAGTCQRNNARSKNSVQVVFGANGPPVSICVFFVFFPTSSRQNNSQ